MAHAAGIFVFTTIIAMMVLYISSLHDRMKSNNIANIQLLDGMHEGLLIRSKSDKKVLFCNRPSQKFLERAISVTEQSSDNYTVEPGKNDKKDFDQTRLYNPKIFEPIKMSA